MVESTVENKARVALFVFLMFIYLVISDFLPAIVPVELQNVVSVVTFFLTIFLIYFTVIVFIEKEGEPSISVLGLQSDSQTLNQLLIGGILGTIGGSVVLLFAILFGGQLRSVAEVTLDLFVNEIIITAPVAFVEELAYRGYLLTRIDRLWGRNTAIIGSSVIFSLLHFGWWIPLGIIPLHLIILFSFNMFLGGVLLCFAYYFSGNRLWVPIGFHFMWNIIAYILFPPFPRAPVTHPEIFQIEWGVTTIISFLFVLSLIYVLEPFMKHKK